MLVNYTQNCILRHAHVALPTEQLFVTTNYVSVSRRCFLGLAEVLEYVNALTLAFSCMPMLSGKLEGPQTLAAFFKRDADCDLWQVLRDAVTMWSQANRQHGRPSLCGLVCREQH